MDRYLTFLDNAITNGNRCELYLCKNKVAVKYEMQTLFDVANGRGLDPIMAQADDAIMIGGYGGSKATFRIPYPGFASRHRGMEYSAIHGMELVEDPEEVAELNARVRA